MLSRDDFVFTIGYDGPAAVIDRGAKQNYAGLSARELAERGLFRAAYAAAVYAENREEIKQVEEIYRSTVHEAARSLSPLDRLFGVFPVEVSRSITL